MIMLCWRRHWGALHSLVCNVHTYWNAPQPCNPFGALWKNESPSFYTDLSVASDGSRARGHGIDGPFFLVLTHLAESRLLIRAPTGKLYLVLASWTFLLRLTGVICFTVKRYQLSGTTETNRRWYFWPYHSVLNSCCQSADSSHKSADSQSKLRPGRYPISMIPFV